MNSNIPAPFPDVADDLKKGWTILVRNGWLVLAGIAVSFSWRPLHEWWSRVFPPVRSLLDAFAWSVPLFAALAIPVMLVLFVLAIRTAAFASGANGSIRPSLVSALKRGTLPMFLLLLLSLPFLFFVGNGVFWFLAIALRGYGITEGFRYSWVLTTRMRRPLPYCAPLMMAFPILPMIFLLWKPFPLVDPVFESVFRCAGMCFLYFGIIMMTIYFLRITALDEASGTEPDLPRGLIHH